MAIKIFMDPKQQRNIDGNSEILFDHESYHVRNTNDSYTIILARALLLFLLTFDIFLNAYVMMSLDRNDLMFGAATIIVGIVGQFAAITGQFGLRIADLLLHIFVITESLVVVLSFLLAQMSHNFMTKISFSLSMLSFLVGIFIVIRSGKA
ncbi:hypothetical protein DERP_000215 [Dermatophagoides pteronyssinus]|uniref:Uncharacterized protein n=1 Tax=Dermatophagoides pteronyssinus TaxID=6956 RepID=A0ABQ8IZH4_DERPT|nr:hypothetical protein DERP_000215 [Dermatophagoides pteronyssinus]